MTLEMEVTYILETKPYELTDGEKVMVIKNWLGLEDLQLIKTFTYEENENAKLKRPLLHMAKNVVSVENLTISRQYVGQWACSSQMDGTEISPGIQATATKARQKLWCGKGKIH